MSGVQNKPGKGGRDQDKQVHGSHANDFALYPTSHGESQAVAPTCKLRDGGRLSQGTGCGDGNSRCLWELFR